MQLDLYFVVNFEKIKNILYDASEYLMSLFSTSPYPRVFYRTNCSLSMRRCHLVK